MKLNKYLRRAAAGMLCLLMCAGLMQPASAVKMEYNRIPDSYLQVKCSLSLDYGVEGLNIRLFYVAGVDTNVKFTAVDAMKKYIGSSGADKANEYLNSLDRDGWIRLAASLAEVLPYDANISHAGRSPTQTDADGKVAFTGLEPGLYLVMNDPAAIGGYNYKTTPYLVCLPYRETGGNKVEWLTELEKNVESKIEKNEISDETGVFVLKKWADKDGNPIAAPDGVTVKLNLYQCNDGEKTQHGETVTLPEKDENGLEVWYHYWSGLSNDGCTWSVEEEENGYEQIKEPVSKDIIAATHPGKVSSIQKCDYYSITNKEKPPTTPPGNTDDPDNTPTPTPSSTPTPGVTPTPGTTPPPSGSNPPTTPPPNEPPEEIELDDPGTPLGPPPLDEDPPDEPEEIELDDPDTPLGNLPQTGMLWWPVPILAVSGMFLFLIGWALRRRSDADEE